MKKKKKKIVKIWGLWDKRKKQLTYVTLQKGNWYIAPSIKKDFKVSVVAEIEVYP